MATTRILWAAATALAVAAPGAAPAQIPVTDALANMQAQIANSHLVQQVAQAVATVRQLELQYQQLQSTYLAITRATSVAGLANRLGGVAQGFGADEIGGALTGMGSLAGTAERVANMGVFSSTGTDFSATELTRRARQLGSLQDAALQGMRQAEQRILGMRELMGEIDGQPDIQSMAALQNRIQAEHALLSAQQQQLVQIQLLAQAQQQVDQLRAQGERRRQAEAWRDSLRPLPEAD